MVKFVDAKIDVIVLANCDVITGSEPTKTNSNDSQFVPSGGFSIGH